MELPIETYSFLQLEVLPIMSLNEISGEDFVGTNATVVRSLWWGEAAWGPSKWAQVRVQQDVFLLNTEPRFFVTAFVVSLLTL